MVNIYILESELWDSRAESPLSAHRRYLERITQPIEQHISTQIETRFDRPIASRCAPPWPSKRRSKPESIRRSCWKWNRNRLPMCATVAIDFQTEVKIAPENIMRRSFRRSRFEPDFGAKIDQKSTRNRQKSLQNRAFGPPWVDLGCFGSDFCLLRLTLVALGGSLGASWSALGRARAPLGRLGGLLGAKKSPKTAPKRPEIAKIAAKTLPRALRQPISVEILIHNRFSADFRPIFHQNRDRNSVAIRARLAQKDWSKRQAANMAT